MMFEVYADLITEDGDYCYQDEHGEYMECDWYRSFQEEWN